MAAPPRKPNARPRRKKKELPWKPTPAEITEWARSHPDVSLLDLFEPTVSRFDAAPPGTPQWVRNLSALYSLTPDVPKDVVAERFGTARSTVYSWLAQDRGKQMGVEDLKRLAAVWGIPPEALMLWRETEMLAWVAERWPGYALDFGGGSSVGSSDRAARRPGSVENTADIAA